MRLPRNIILISLLLVLLASCSKPVVVSELCIVPEPVFQVKKARTFTVTTTTRLCFENVGQNTPTAKYIAKALRKFHVHTPLTGRRSDNAITFAINDSVNVELGEEGYLLEVRPAGIMVSANTEAGLFYGCQTLLQILPVEANGLGGVVLPECTVLDYPAYAWRGSRLDVCHHFYDVKQVKRHLDLMAAYKLNRLHLLLANDYGWRVEVDHYPALNDIGSWRPDRSGVKWQDIQPAKDDEDRSYGGYYSKKEIEEIVEYAAQRHIVVVPEFDLPAQSAALLSSYPEMACEGAKPSSVQVGPVWPHADVLCMGNDYAMEALAGILDDLMPLFPGGYIGVGVSEADLDRWERCPRCQKRMRQEGLSEESQLYGWFLSRVDEYLSRHGMRLVAHCDVSQMKFLSSDAVAVCPQEMLRELPASGPREVVVSSADYCSLDYRQGDARYFPFSIGGELTLRKAYMYHPMMNAADRNTTFRPSGALCSLGSECLNDYGQAEFQLLPRLCAMAECLWTDADNKDYARFRHSIEFRKQALAESGYTVCAGSFKPIVAKVATADGRYRVSMESEVEGTYVYYTVNGDQPTAESAIYTEPLLLEKGTVLKTVSYFQGSMREGVYDFVID